MAQENARSRSWSWRSVAGQLDHLSSPSTQPTPVVAWHTVPGDSAIRRLRLTRSLSKTSLAHSLYLAVISYRRPHTSRLLHIPRPPTVYVCHTRALVPGTVKFHDISRALLAALLCQCGTYILASFRITVSAGSTL